MMFGFVNLYDVFFVEGLGSLVLDFIICFKLLVEQFMIMFECDILEGMYRSEFLGFEL